MIAYEFYWHDQEGKSHLIGILPERRKNLERITQESIINWGKMAIGPDGDPDSIYFVKIKVESKSSPKLSTSECLKN